MIEPFVSPRGCSHWRKGTRIYLPDIEPRLAQASWLLPPITFHAKVLGDRGSENLLTKTTEQTIRSQAELAGISTGAMVGISLDKRPKSKSYLR